MASQKTKNVSRACLHEHLASLKKAKRGLQARNKKELGELLPMQKDY
jgi:hypothetical protein